MREGPERRLVRREREGERDGERESEERKGRLKAEMGSLARRRSRGGGDEWWFDCGGF